MRQPATDDLLGDAEPLLHVRRLRAAVDIRRVEEVNAGVEGFVHDPEADGFIGQLAEIHRAQRQPAYLQAGSAQMCVVHFKHSLLIGFE